MKVINPCTFSYKDIVGINLRTQIKLFKRNDISFVSINRPNFDSGHLASWTDRKFNLCHSGLTSLTSHELCQDSQVLCSANILHWTSLYIGSLRLLLSWVYRIPLALGALTLMRNLEFRVRTQPPSFFRPHMAFFSKVLRSVCLPSTQSCFFFLPSFPLRLFLSLNSVLLNGFCSSGGKKGKLGNKLSFPFLFCY